MASDRFESVFETQPLGVVLRSGAAHLLSGWADSPSWMGRPISDTLGLSRPPALLLYGVPWLQDWAAEPERAEQAVEVALGDLRSRLGGEPGTVPPVLVVTHAPLYPPGTEPAYEHYPVKRLAGQLGPHVRGCYYGHVHEPHGSYEVDGIRFANVGALSRGSLHEHNLNRAPSVAIWEDGQFEQVELPHRPAAEVFLLAEAVVEQKARVSLEEFLAGVGRTTLEVTSIESVLDHVRQLGLAPAVLGLVEELLAAAQADG